MFYLIWEAKESYCIPFLFLLVLLGANGGSTVAEAKFNLRKMCKAVLPVCMCLTIILAAINFSTFSLDKRNYKDLSVKCNNTSGWTYVADVANKNSEINQQFFTSKSFDSVDMYCKPLKGDAVYDVMIYNQENQMLARQQVSGKNITGRFLTVKFPKIKSSGYRQRYTVRIAPFGKSKQDSIAFAAYRYLRLSGYDGSLKIGGEDVLGDMLMNVYRAYKGVQLRPMLYILAAIVLLGIQAAAWISICKRREKDV